MRTEIPGNLEGLRCRSNHLRFSASFRMNSRQEPLALPLLQALELVVVEDDIDGSHLKHSEFIWEEVFIGYGDGPLYLIDLMPGRIVFLRMPTETGSPRFR